MDAIEAYEKEMVRDVLPKLQAIEGITVYGPADPEKHTGVITFNLEGIHPHDLATAFDMEGIAVRAGHHCAQPLLAHLGLNATARASFAFYNTDEDVDRFLESLSTLRERMGYGK